MNREDIISALDDYGITLSEYCEDDDALFDEAREIIESCISDDEYEENFKPVSMLRMYDITKALEALKKQLVKKRRILTSVDDETVKNLKKLISKFESDMYKTPLPELTDHWWRYNIKITTRKIEIILEYCPYSPSVGSDLQMDFEILGIGGTEYKLVEIPIELDKTETTKQRRQKEKVLVNLITISESERWGDNFYAE